MGFDALAFAADNGNTVMVRELIKAKTDVNHQFALRDNRTALMCASAIGWLEVVMLLLQGNADVGLKTRKEG